MRVYLSISKNLGPCGLHLEGLSRLENIYAMGKPRDLGSVREKLPQRASLMFATCVAKQK